jgi:hypothetical protein
VDLAMHPPDSLWGALVANNFISTETSTNATATTTSKIDEYGENDMRRCRDDDRPFSLTSLENGMCPWRDDEDVALNAPWLPPMPRDLRELSSRHKAH